MLAMERFLMTPPTDEFSVFKSGTSASTVTDSVTSPSSSSASALTAEAVSSRIPARAYCLKPGVATLSSKVPGLMNGIV